jgi:predicted alpha/beta hydrolase family esterase
MVKKIYIVHGWGATPKEPMLVWLKNELEKNGFKVVFPEMPNTEEPEINAWVNKLKQIVGDLNEDTYFFGHSIGCQTILRYLEKQPSDVKVGGIVFLAPWFHLQGIEDEEGVEEIAKPWLETPIDLNRVKSHTDKIVAIFSDDDPYVPVSETNIFKERLNAKTIVEHKKGHFIGEYGVDDNSRALKELLEIAK